MPMSPLHYVVAVLVAVTAGLLASSFFGAWKRERHEARAAIEALSSLKWREYSHLVEAILIDRGFKRGGGERRPGQGGFDLLMERGSGKFVVDCKNGASHEVNEKAVRDLATVMQMNGAEGGVIVTTGSADDEARKLAAQRRIEILCGEELWRQAQPRVPAEMREEVQSEARAQRNRLAIYSAGAGFAAGALALMLVPALQQGAVDIAAEQLVPAAEQITEDAGGEPLSEEALARRALAVRELRGVETVLSATWDKDSTLRVKLKPGTGHSVDLPKELCERLVQFSDLRDTRMQLETPSDDIDAPPQVRWRQCR